MPKNPSYTPSQLRELRSEMEENFARLLRSMSNGPATAVFPADDAGSPDLQPAADELDAVLHARTQARLHAVTAALRRFETGDYGECVRCGAPIPFGRLVVMPEATVCNTCSAT